MYKAVIFDLGKVLIPFDFKRGYEALAACCPHPAPDVRQRIKATGLVTPFETGLIEPRDFVARLCEALSLTMNYEEFSRAWGSIFYGQLIPDSVLASLAQRYRLVLLSNTNALHFEMIRENYALLDHFHDLVLSYEVRSMKPDPRIYEVAIDRAGCRPEECFYTDDIAENVEGGKRLGIDAIIFESPEQLRREMTNRGITW
jgi:epoxide hydrolase-like predicted phosphatase